MNKQLRSKENKPIESARITKLGTTQTISSRTASPINQILSKMRRQQSPNLSARSPCSSRISHDCEQTFQMENILEMEERKKKIRELKHLLMENADKLLELDSLQYQIQHFEESLNIIVKRFKSLKRGIIEQINRQYTNQQSSIQLIKESIKQMSEDIQLNETNIIKEIQMKPFNRIISAYKQQCNDHLDQLEMMIHNTRQQFEFKEMCQQIEQKLLQISNASPHFKEV